MTPEHIAEILDLCRLNNPAWWELVESLPTDEDRLDALVMLARREYELQGGGPTYHLNN